MKITGLKKINLDVVKNNKVKNYKIKNILSNR